MVFQLILLLISIQIIGIPIAFNIESIVLVTNSLLIIYYFFLNVHQIELEYSKIKIYVFLLTFYTSYLCLGFISSDYRSFIILSLHVFHALLVLAFIYSNFNKKKYYIANYFWYSSLFLSACTIIIYFINYDQQRLEFALPRANALLGNPNTLGITLLILSLFVLYKKRFHLFDYLVIFLNVVAIALTVSRSTILILFIILVSIFLKSKVRFVTKSVVTISAVIVSFLTYRVIKSFNENYFNRFNVLDNDDFDNGRIEALVMGFNNFYKGFFGVGIGNTADTGGQSAHNFYLEVVAQSGVLLLPFILIILCYFSYLLIVSFKINNHFLISFSIILLLYGFFSHRIHV